MLRVTVELVPYGRFAERRAIHLLDIANDGTGGLEWGSYVYRIARVDAAGRRHWGRTTRYRGHRRADGALVLTAAILAAHRTGPRERAVLRRPRDDRRGSAR